MWTKSHPQLKIRSPALDTCVACNIFRNISKYKSSVTSELSPNTTLLCPETNEPSLLKIPNDEEEVDREDLVLAAGKHVKAARAQKQLANEKMQEARLSLSSGDSNTITLVLDYCQNLDLSHLEGEQLGDTYYFSPI